MKNRLQKGFIALTLIISVSALLFVFSFIQSTDIIHFFDETTRKEYRLMSYYYAYSCIDYALLTLSHDYFFLTTEPIDIKDLHCTIDSVIDRDGKREIYVHGNYQNISVYRSAIAIVHDSSIEIVSIK